KLPRMFALALRKYVTRHIGGIGLECIKRGHAHGEVVENNLRHVLFISGQRDNAEGAGAGYETKRRQARKTPSRTVLVQYGPEEAYPGFIYCRGSESLGVAHDELLCPRRGDRWEARHLRGTRKERKRVRHVRAIKMVIPRPVSGFLVIEIPP